MDISTTIGILLGLISLTMGFLMEGGSMGALLQLGAAIIVFGGTFGAVIASYTLGQLKMIVPLLKVAFMEKKHDPLDTINKIVEMATVSRREGILYLENHLEEFENNKFMQKGLQMIIDGSDPELVRDILNLEISYIQERHHIGAKVFETAGGFAPTMGIIGTVMGLVHVLSNLSEPSELGHAIALAFIATLYGVASANVIYFPIGNKLKVRSQSEILLREIEAEGLLSLQAGENPQIIREKLLVFLPPSRRIELSKQRDAAAQLQGEEA